MTLKLKNQSALTNDQLPKIMDCIAAFNVEIRDLA
jgi:hypothetical protein